MPTTELADAIGAEKSAITRLFSPSVTVSRMSRKVARTTLIPRGKVESDSTGVDFAVIWYQP